MLSFLLAFAIVMLGMPSLIQLALQRNLLDEPSEDRKVHKRSVPRLGGVLVFIGTLFTTCLLVHPEGEGAQRDLVRLLAGKPEGAIACDQLDLGERDEDVARWRALRHRGAERFNLGLQLRRALAQPLAERVAERAHLLAEAGGMHLLHLARRPACRGLTAGPGRAIRCEIVDGYRGPRARRARPAAAHVRVRQPDLRVQRRVRVRHRVRSNTDRAGTWRRDAPGRGRGSRLPSRSACAGRSLSLPRGTHRAPCRVDVVLRLHAALVSTLTRAGHGPAETAHIQGEANFAAWSWERKESAKGRHLRNLQQSS